MAKRRINARAWAKTDRGRMMTRERWLRRMYGIDRAAVLTMLDDQGHACAICRHPLTERTLHVDHDHREGIENPVRGVLCGSCNKGIGLLGDCPETISRAVDYLRR